MTWGEILNYVAISNPVSQAVFSSTASILKGVGSKVNRGTENLPPPKPITLLDLIGKNYHFVRFAGLSGTTAVIMGAYGKHNLAKIHDIQEQMDAKAVFETANKFHFLHSFALLAMPLVQKPKLTGLLMAVGCLLFCGPMYYRALTGNKTYNVVATCGGFCLIAAWASLIF